MFYPYLCILSFIRYDHRIASCSAVENILIYDVVSHHIQLDHIPCFFILCIVYQLQRIFCAMICPSTYIVSFLLSLYIMHIERILSHVMHTNVLIYDLWQWFTFTYGNSQGYLGSLGAETGILIRDNCVPQYSVGCRYLSLSDIPVSGPYMFADFKDTSYCSIASCIIYSPPLTSL